MKKMLAGIFLMVLGVWFLNFSSLSNATPLAVISIILPFVAAIMFFVGYFENKE